MDQITLKKIKKGKKKLQVYSIFYQAMKMKETYSQRFLSVVGDGV